MVSPFLIISVVIVAPLLLFMCFMLLGYFIHEDDKSEAYFPKVVTVFGLFLAFGSVLVLPYDVANQRGNGGLRVDILWQMIYMAMAIFLSILIPFAFFYYESDMDPDRVVESPVEEDSCCNCWNCWLCQLCDGCCEGQFWTAVKFTIGFFFVFTFMLVVLFVVIHDAEIPVHRIAQSTSLVVDLSASFTRTAPSCVESQGCVEGDITLVIPVTFPVYVIGFLSFVGWFFFVLFAGVGLVALPMDLVNEFRTRPPRMLPSEYRREREKLGQRANYLLNAGLTLQKEMDNPTPTRKAKKNMKKTMKKFEAAYYFLKQDYHYLRTAWTLRGGNPLWYVLKLVLGILGGIVSITWIVHIAIFVLPKKPINPFLNTFFIELESVGGGGFPLFGIVAFAIYAFWLIWCVVKGNFRIGARFLCIKLYPMELHNTLMNAFLFNTWLIILCSVPVVQFCVRAFPVYARLTSADMLLGTQVQHLQFFRYFWQNNVFVIAMLAMSFMTLVIQALWPRDKAQEVQDMLDMIEDGDADDD